MCEYMWIHIHFIHVYRAGWEFNSLTSLQWGVYTREYSWCWSDILTALIQICTSECWVWRLSSDGQTSFIINVLQCQFVEESWSYCRVSKCVCNASDRRTVLLSTVQKPCLHLPGRHLQITDVRSILIHKVAHLSKFMLMLRLPTCWNLLIVMRFCYRDRIRRADSLLL